MFYKETRLLRAISILLYVYWIGFYFVFIEIYRFFVSFWKRIVFNQKRKDTKENWNKFKSTVFDQISKYEQKVAIVTGADGTIGKKVLNLFINF